MSLTQRNPRLLIFALVMTMSANQVASETLKTPEPEDVPYHCGKLPAEGGHDWASLRQFLHSCPRLDLAQHWLKQPEPSFAPASVSVAWQANFLCIFAKLQDRDIFNPTMGLNQPAYLHGDIFEIMLRPLTGEAYFEFHITPHGQILQLRFPQKTSLADFRESGGKSEDLIDTFKIPQPILETHTEIQRTENTWEVIVKIPATSITSQPGFQPGDSLLFSFCRYDHSHGQPAPTLSSTSQHPVCSFHRQEEWRLMKLD